MFIPNKNKTTVIDASGMMEDWPINQVPYRDSDGTIKGTGLRILSRGTLLAPVGFAVESGSVDFGDVLRLSESAGFLAFENMIDNSKYQLLDYAVPRDAPSSKPFYFKLATAEVRFEASKGSGSVLRGNPLTWEYTTKLTARTNALVFNATEKMYNVRLRITDKKSGVAIKYYPSKSAWVDASGGTILDPGENVLDFQDTAVIFSANTDIIFDIQADNVALVGDTIPWFAGLVQQGSFIGVADAFDVSGLQQQIDNQKQEFKGDYSALVGVPSTFAPAPHTHVVGDIQGLSTKLTELSAGLSSKLDASGSIDLNKISGLSQILINKIDVSSISNVGKTGNYADLTNKPNIPQNLSQFNNDPGFITISQIPQQVINWDDVANKPSKFTPSAHQHQIVDIVGLQATLNAKLDASSTISYNSLTDKPTIPTVSYPVTSVAGRKGDILISTADVSGLSSVAKTNNYSSLSGLPSIPAAQVNSDWNAMTGVAQILNKPAIPSTISQFSDASAYAKKSDINYPVNSVNSKTGVVVLNAADVSAAAIIHTHQLSDVSGLSSLIASKADSSSVAKVRYYRVTSDSSSVWTVNTGTEFAEVYDVQVQPVSVANTIAGIRQCSLNDFTVASKTFSGMTYGNSVITSLLITAGANTLQLLPNTVVRVRVEGK